MSPWPLPRSKPLPGAAASASEFASSSRSSTGAGSLWKHAVIQEIYPRSFQDSNGDGVGDINGITSRLDYLRDLGIGAIGISPMYPSPLVDFGYDISDYTAIDPLYRTMADFDRLVSEAKKRNIQVIMDFVPNQDLAEACGSRTHHSTREGPNHRL